MKKSLFTVALKWGTLLGLALASVQFLRIFNKMEYFSIGPILDMMQFAALIGLLLLGMKEYRDEVKGGVIKFAKAFSIGVVMVLIAFVLVTVYFVIQFNYIDKDGLTELNERNLTRYTERIGKDTVTRQEIEQYVDHANLLLQSESEKVDYSQEDALLKENLVMLKEYYGYRLLNRQLKDSSDYQLANFDKYAQRELIALTEQLIAEQKDSAAQNSALTTIVQSTVRELQQDRVFDQRYRSGIDGVPKYTNSFASALYFALTTLLFGLLIAIFTALYVYRGKKEQV